MTPHAVGRPRRISEDLINEIVRLRELDLDWRGIGDRLGLAAETCRRAAWARKRGQRTVVNSPAEEKPGGPP